MGGKAEYGCCQTCCGAWHWGSDGVVAEDACGIVGGGGVCGGVIESGGGTGCGCWTKYVGGGAVCGCG